MLKKKVFSLWVVISLIPLFGITSIHAEPFDGFTLFNPVNSVTTTLLDMDGQIAHQWNNERGGGYAVYLLENSNLLRPALVDRPILRGAAYSGLIQVMDWDGNLVWEFEYNTATYITHHDLEPMPNGNVLAIAWEVKSPAEATQAGRIRAAFTWPDHIIEVEPDGEGGANIVWEWHVWDHLIQDFDDRRDNFGVVADHPELFDVNMAGRGGGGPGGGGDWLHVNGISYNPTLDQIVISSHFADEFYVIDHSTTTEEAVGHEGGDWGRGGDILYRWGCPTNYDAEGEHYFDVVHCSWWIPEGLPGAGNILAFNNGEGDRASVIIEIVPPYDNDGNYIIEEGEAFGPENPVWTYSDGGDFYSNHLGGCQRLPNGNTLISESTREHLLEVDVDGNIVWEYNDRNQIARSLRYAHDYPGLYFLHPVGDGVLVINEFLIDNTEIEADQNDEFDPWIEIYNNSDEDLSLWGVYLSNNSDDPTMWAFPDTSIAANDYLIVWADNEAEQEGLHANFELSADGGIIIFSAPDESAIDEIEYAGQTSDISFGRFPNGTGDFKEMTPSFSTSNNDGVLSIGDYGKGLPDGFSMLHNYPNPFNPSTTISFRLDSASEVTLTVFNNNGTSIAKLLNESLSAGLHKVIWNGYDEYGEKVSSGIYLYSLQAGNINETRKALLIR